MTLRRRGILGAVVLAGTGVLVPAGSRAQTAADAKALQGAWEGHIAEPRGERPGPVRFAEVVITADRIRAKRLDGSDMGEGSYRLGSAQQVRTLDAVGLAGEPRGKSFLGIYEVRDGTLRWCVANPGRPRPQEFASRPGAGQFLLVLKRKR